MDLTATTGTVTVLPGSLVRPVVRRRVVTGLVVAPRRPADDHPWSTAVDRPGTTLTARVPGELVARELARHHDASPRRGDRLVVRAPRAAALRRWYLTTVAHERVGAVLAGLDARHHVLHAVPTDDGRGVDHLLVGPSGVVVLRTAHHGGERVRVQGRQVRADGRPVDHVRDVEQQVSRVAALLGTGSGRQVAVRGLVVLVGARSVHLVDVPRAVTVLTDAELPGWLARRPRTASQVLVDRIARRAADPRTWGVGDRPDDAARRAHGRACTEATRVALGHRRPRRRGPALPSV